MCSRRPDPNDTSKWTVPSMTFCKQNWFHLNWEWQVVQEISSASPQHCLDQMCQPAWHPEIGNYMRKTVHLPCLAHPAFNTISPCKATSFTNVIDIVSMQHITQIPSILMFPSCPHTAFYCPPISSRHAPVYARLRYGQEYSGDWIVSSPRTLRGDLWTGRAAPPVIFVGGSVDL